jgi:hypothetical protein
MRVEKIHLLCLSLALAPACVVEEADDDDTSAETEGDDSNTNAEASDGDDSNGDDSAGDDSNGDDSAGDDSNGDDSNGDDSAGDDSNGDDSAGTSNGDDSAGTSNGDDSSDDGPIGDAIPQEGAWLYSETGGTTNDCTFVADPSNGWGTYLVESASASGFTVAPGDGSAAFDCELEGGAFHCPERLVETIEQAGFDVVANVFVVVDGDIVSSTTMTGSQIGHIECEGTQCAEAEAFLGVSFPCDFEVPFAGDKT